MIAISVTKRSAERCCKQLRLRIARLSQMEEIAAMLKPLSAEEQASFRDILTRGAPHCAIPERSWADIFHDERRRVCHAPLDSGVDSSHVPNHDENATPRSTLRLPAVDLGSQFPFMNRDAECEQLIAVFEENESVRLKALTLHTTDRWDTQTRNSAACVHWHIRHR
jgi:hypothetical protein